ncbi:SDR family NAD(P)-dependent oxidoreductase [Agromyces larvae]|uniref:SDR family oxidoreductase n=1 Tax=Agromyces larvae TaxID=2929802 RepID=A0ABY4C444_9MICO|nr:SDR family oxidoreductase [Agromyces larvae]UOE45749.1 SDR family oxidoreductase [Agromyces larvae]
MSDGAMVPRNAGRVVLVTGAGAGIGRAIATAFLETGAIVGALDRAVADVPAGAEPIEADVTDDAGIEASVAAFGARHGRIDVLVSNAGVSYPATVTDGELADWTRVYDVNVLGMVRVTRAALPWLRRSEAASITLMGSCTVRTGLKRRVLYAGTKGAVEAMSRAMAADLVDEGIRVNCVAPGTVDTPLIGALIEAAPDPGAQRRAYDERQPTGVMVRPEEVARGVLYLSDADATSIVGSVLAIDGGLTSLKPLPR